MTDKDLKKLGDLITNKIKDALRLVNLRQGNMEYKLEMIYTRLEAMDEKLDNHDKKIKNLATDISVLQDKTDALLLDTNYLKDLVGALGDKIDANVDITKRQIQEIREELNLPSS